MAPVNVLFVCLGNICRSPTAHGVFRHLVEREGLSDVIHTDSAGTGAWHIGDPPDSRAQAAARQRGVDLADLRARQAKPEDFSRFNYIIAMDRQNHRNLEVIQPPGAGDRLHMFLSFTPEWQEIEVPDPYYGGDQGFERVLDMIEDASKGLLEHIRTHDLAG